MDDFIIARVLHALAIVMWIGGVGFVTTVLMPTVRQSALPEERLREFHRAETRFAPQAAAWVLLAGASGLWMTWRADLWHRFADPQYWWMHAMVAIWLAFALMLFLIEPLFLHKRVHASENPRAISHEWNGRTARPSCCRSQRPWVLWLEAMAGFSEGCQVLVCPGHRFASSERNLPGHKPSVRR